MSYISARQKGDNVIVWERTEEGRQEVLYTAPHYFYVEDPNGKHLSVYGDRVTKVVCSNKDDFYKKRKEFEDNGYRLFESDIPAEMRILSQHYYGKPAPKLHITFLDIEVDYNPEIGFAGVSNSYASINSVAFFHEWLNQLVVLTVPPVPNVWTAETLMEAVNQAVPDVPVPEQYNTRIVVCKNERELLGNLLAEIEDSDVICGWNSDMFDVPYIASRIEKTLGKQYVKHLDFPGFTPTPREVFSRNQFDNQGKPKKLGDTIDLWGRVRIDYMMLYRKYEPGEKASYKLSSIEQEVGLNLPKLEYSGSLHSLYRDNYPFFIRYNIRDTEILHGFEKKLAYVELANQMCHLSGGMFEHVGGTLKLAENAIVNYCHHTLNQVVPNSKRPDIDRQIAGALVLLPQAALHEWVGSIDINSLYPSAIRSLNISPETIRGQFDETVRACEEIAKRSIIKLTLRLETGEEISKQADEFAEWLAERKWAVSGYGTVFDQNKQGIIPTILADWYNMRKQYQAKMKQAINEGDQESAGYYDRLQYVFKIKLNSLYGALTNLYFRFYDLRMGESTTGTGRMILRHQCRKVAEILDGDYNVDFPLYETIKEAEESGLSPNVALHGPLFRGHFQSESVIYGDTDSTYFKTHTDNKEDAVKIADAVAAKVNASYKAFMQNTFLCNPGFDDIIKCGREIVTDRGIFVDKKRYILHIVDKEGKSTDSMKVMGLDTKKTTLPKHVADTLNGFIEKYLKGTPWEEVAKCIVAYKDELRTAKDVTLIGLPKGIKGVEEYAAKFKTGGDSTRLPGHVAAAIHYNQCLKQYGDKESPPIVSDMKIKVFYLTKTYGKFKSVALPTDIEIVPQWFLDNFEIDYDAHIERLVDNPLQNILNAIGKRTPTKQDLLMEDLFGF